MEQMLGNPKSTPQDTPSRGATVAIFSVAIFSCELPDIPILPTDKPPVGIDVGLEAFLTTSGGEREPNPHYLKDALPELRKARAVSRKIEGSENRRRRSAIAPRSTPGWGTSARSITTRPPGSWS